MLHFGEKREKGKKRGKECDGENSLNLLPQTKFSSYATAKISMFYIQENFSFEGQTVPSFSSPGICSWNH